MYKLYLSSQSAFFHLTMDSLSIIFTLHSIFTLQPSATPCPHSHTLSSATPLPLPSFTASHSHDNNHTHKFFFFFLHLFFFFIRFRVSASPLATLTATTIPTSSSSLCFPARKFGKLCHFWYSSSYFSFWSWFLTRPFLIYYCNIGVRVIIMYQGVVARSKTYGIEVVVLWYTTLI